jgi:hypothetical protein
MLPLCCLNLFYSFVNSSLPNIGITGINISSSIKFTSFHTLDTKHALPITVDLIQLGANEGRFILLVFTISFIAANIHFDIYYNHT